MDEEFSYIDEEWSDEDEPLDENFYNLEETEINWEAVEPSKIGDYRWEFSVTNREVGRKIACVFGNSIGMQPNQYDRLCNPEPIDDLRIDGLQISFFEFDEDDSAEGDIIGVGISLRHSSETGEWEEKYTKGLEAVLAKIPS